MARKKKESIASTADDASAGRRREISDLEARINESWRASEMTGCLAAADALEALDPTNGLPHHVRGLSFRMRGQGADARREFARARDLRYPATLGMLVELGLDECVADSAEASH